MELKRLLAFYSSDPRTLALTDYLSGHPQPMVHLKGMVGSLPAFVICGQIQQKACKHLFILPDKDEAAYFQNDLKSLLPKKDILFFPDSFKRPGTFRETNKNNILLRAESLARFTSGDTRSALMITYPEALFEKVVEKKTLRENTIQIKIGEKLDMDFMIEFLVEYGFERSDFVYEPGHFSIRGGIIDIFSFGNELPYRIELFDDEVESIRTFNPLTQQSAKKIARVSIVPNIQTHFESAKKVSLLSYLSSSSLLWIKDAALVKEKMLLCEEQLSVLNISSHLVENDEAHPIIDRDNKAAILDAKSCFESLKKKGVLEFGHRFLFEPDLCLDYASIPQVVFNKNYRLFADTLTLNSRKGILNFLFAAKPKQLERYHHIFEDLGISPQFYPIPSIIHEGFSDTDLKIACFTDHQIFNRFHKYKLRESFDKNMVLSIKTLRELQPGDYITHIDHGIGIYSGLEKLEINGVVQESVRIKYRDNDLLYVGINSLHKISKYAGKDGSVPAINKLGNGAWEALKRKTRKKVKDIAKDLIKLYAERKARKGYAFQPDSYLQDELEASFIYEDTPDQLKATLDTKKDMEQENPMDRLICGDVGFGKTEIAIRAAFKAVADSKQVVVLVPTTILATQHFRTFSERLDKLPATIDYLNRFKTPAQRKRTLQNLETGKIDIIIGTHALLGKHVKFKDLGLLIIDEEQKFGVAAKERLKALKVNVDTLTLTATPIPRTLQFSMMGARDLSVIQTPPPNRQPIHTELHVLDEKIIREAINYEYNRGGQVFFIHNRVRDIHEISDMVKRLCPQVNIGIAHGQMEGRTLEKQMMGFIEQKYDVLISTSIIESGLDIPNANTIIIHNAHQFGLSDLHQMRGRVGRSNRKAFCYLFSPPLSSLTREAKLRLTTIEQYAELGSGFQIAMRDLDIRGAGNLLGGEQSGFIAEIGFNMYQKILDEAILELKETEFKSLFSSELKEKTDYVNDCQVDTDFEILLPSHYVQNINERLSLYTQLNGLKTGDELESFKAILEDRFGPVPSETLALMDAIRLQWLAVKIGFERIVLKNGKMQCYFIGNQLSSFYESKQFKAVLHFIQQNSRFCHIKQTPKYLYITINQIHSIEKARVKLEYLLAAVNSHPK